MQSGYSSCNKHLILKSFFVPLYIRLVPWTTSESTMRLIICDDVNLDKLVISESGVELGFCLLWELISRGRLVMTALGTVALHVDIYDSVGEKEM